MSRILIVDDEKLLVKGMRFNFEQEGYQVVTAYDGEEALKLAKDKSLDIIICETDDAQQHCCYYHQYHIDIFQFAYQA